MNDKTCDTCAHCAKRHGLRDVIANRVCMYMGCLIIDECGANCGGMYYEKRIYSTNRFAKAARCSTGEATRQPDSVEQLASDMIKALSEICIDCCVDHCCNLTAIGWPHDFCTNDMLDRAEELGVIKAHG